MHHLASRKQPQIQEQIRDLEVNHRSIAVISHQDDQDNRSPYSGASRDRPPNRTLNQPRPAPGSREAAPKEPSSLIPTLASSVRTSLVPAMCDIRGASTAAGVTQFVRLLASLVPHGPSSKQEIATVDLDLHLFF